MENELSILCVGDIIIGKDGNKYFDNVRSVFKNADLVIGQLEVPYTDKNEESLKLERHPNNLKALKEAGFDALSLAGNHITDSGKEGIEDTTSALQDIGLASFGAGMNLDEARRPLVINRNGTKIGMLKYNCVGPEETWATDEKPGCAYIQVLTHYELEHANPGGPPEIYTRAEPSSLQLMKQDIQRVREQCDILIVSFHKGLVHRPIEIASYEHEISYAAIDAGADLIIGEHAHLLKGIEFYKEKPIFHGLGNFATYLPFSAFNSDSLPRDWGKKRRQLFGFEPDPNYPTFPFHPEGRYTMISKLKIENKQIKSVRYIPCFIQPTGYPEMVDEGSSLGEEVFNYMKTITEQADLNASFQWDGKEVKIYEQQGG